MYQSYGQYQKYGPALAKTNSQDTLSPTPYGTKGRPQNQLRGGNGQPPMGGKGQPQGAPQQPPMGGKGQPQGALQPPPGAMRGDGMLGGGAQAMPEAMHGSALARPIPPTNPNSQNPYGLAAGPAMTPQRPIPPGQANPSASMPTKNKRGTVGGGPGASHTQPVRGIIRGGGRPTGNQGPAASSAGIAARGGGNYAPAAHTRPAPAPRPRSLEWLRMKAREQGRGG